MNLPTPCVIIDMRIVEKNIERMAKLARQHEVALRPHIKTHKLPGLAKKQVDSGAQGITVAKVSEAEIMAAHGLNDIFIAYPIIGEHKIKRVLELNNKVNLITGVDSLEGAESLATAVRLAGQNLQVRLEVDTGLKRTGVEYSKALELGKKISGMEGLELTGIYTFRGLIFQGETTLAREKAGLEEGELMVSLAEQLRTAGVKIRDVSVGSTPTAEYAAQVFGVTEIRPGTYIFNDMMQVSTNTCSVNDCAAKLLVTVISAPSEKHVVIDGGSKTFATDIIPNTYPYNLSGFGYIEGYDNLVLERLTEEHGIIVTKENPKKPKTGQQLKIIPNHICTTINLHNKVYFCDGETLTEAVVEARGMVY